MTKPIYIPVIGLEIHVELNTKTKMFCGCSADYFGKEPNTHTCPICLGLPGALPYVNGEALEKCMMIGLALNCKISENSYASGRAYFERKNYFYPDLPKGYQISQYRKPLCVDGSLDLSDGTKVAINRVHQEEDTGKLFHKGEETLIDYNRSGVPLVEVVTEPDFTDSGQVVEFAKTLHGMLHDLNVSNADMERGDVRLEANVSVRPESQTELPHYRIELKNINSFRFMQQAIEYEIKRQAEELEKGTKLVQETRGWNEDKKETYLQREKEEAHDYRYFPEPDIPELEFSETDKQKIGDDMPKLSGQRASELADKYAIAESVVRTLITQGMTDFFEEVANDKSLDPKDIANAIVNKRINTDSVDEFKEKLVSATATTKISEEDLEIAVATVIKHNEKAVEDFQNGKESVIQFLIGQVMKETKGKANADSVLKMLKEKIQK